MIMFLAMNPSDSSELMRNDLKWSRDDNVNKRIKENSTEACPAEVENCLFTSTNRAEGANGPLPGRHSTTPESHIENRSYRETSSSESCVNSPKTPNHSNKNYVANNTDSEASHSNQKPCDNKLETNEFPCQRYNSYLDRGDHLNAPSTSGSSKVYDNGPIDNSAFKESRKRPSSLKLNRPNYNEEDSSSDTGNDDYSLGSEDGCIYTYRGGEHLADLPSSFFSLDMGLPLDKQLPPAPNYAIQRPEPLPNAGGQRSRASSPDQDFLEMDFDPGPSCEADTGDESSPDLDLDVANDLPVEEEVVVARGTTPDCHVSLKPLQVQEPQPSGSGLNLPCYDMPSTSRGVICAKEEEAGASSQECGPYITHVNSRGERLVVMRTMLQGSTHMAAGLHVSSGDLVSPREVLNHEDNEETHFAYQINQGERPTFDPVNLSSALYHLNMVKKLMCDNSPQVETIDPSTTSVSAASPDRPAQFSLRPTEVPVRPVDLPLAPSEPPIRPVEPPRSMVWSEREACERQVTQIGTSACGATAVVNVFIALGVPVNVDSVNAAVGTRQRANNAPLPRYLLSRAVAGCTAADLVSGLHKASEGLVTARFFPTYPERIVSLSHWLADWISLGAVPILTLNLQVCSEPDIPDAWHHQMVFGVSPRGVYLCNPVECLKETTLWPRLTSPSVLLVRTRDVLSRFTPRTDLTPLMAVPDRRFHKFNVLGQVVNVIREWRATGWSENGVRTRHIRIPASYQAGITIAVLTGSEAHRRLMHASQLPIIKEDKHNM